MVLNSNFLMSRSGSFEMQRIDALGDKSVTFGQNKLIILSQDMTSQAAAIDMH